MANGETSPVVTLTGRTYMTDLERLTAVLRDRYSAATCGYLVDDVRSRSAAIKVIDCVLSLNRRFDRLVVPATQRFASKRPDVRSLLQLRELIDQCDTPLTFSKTELQYNDARRADVLCGVVDYLLQAQQEHEGKTESERLEAWATWARPGDYLSVGVKGFALAGFQYLRMLFGAQTTKPDVHVRKFVSTAIGHSVSDIQALYLLDKAAKIAGLPIRQLDADIWESEARGGGPASASRFIGKEA